jgi:hypothetical protein
MNDPRSAYRLATSATLGLIICPANLGFSRNSGASKDPRRSLYSQVLQYNPPVFIFPGADCHGLLLLGSLFIIHLAYGPHPAPRNICTVNRGYPQGLLPM